MPELATWDKCSLLYTEIDVKDYQNWQLWTIVVFSIERRVSKIARNGNFATSAVFSIERWVTSAVFSIERWVSKIARIGNFGQV